MLNDSCLKPSAILREAARLVESGEELGGCSAIKVATDRLWRGLRAGGYTYVAHSAWLAAAADKYFNLLCPEDGCMFSYWWPERLKHGPRIVGLCLAAAIAKSEGN